MANRRMYLLRLDSCYDCPHVKLRIHVPHGAHFSCQATEPEGREIGCHPMTNEAETRPPIPDWCPLPADIFTKEST